MNPRGGNHSGLSVHESFPHPVIASLSFPCVRNSNGWRNRAQERAGSVFER